MRKWIDRLKGQFVEGARHWYQWWSTWLAILWSIIVTAFWNDPGVFMELVNSLPEQTRAALSPLVLAFVAAIPIITRLLKQKRDELTGKS